MPARLDFGSFEYGQPGGDKDKNNCWRPDHRNTWASTSRMLQAPGTAAIWSDQGAGVSRPQDIRAVAQLRPRRRAQLFQHAVPTELVHEVGNHTVEVEAAVEAGVGEVDEVRGRHRHLIEVDLACDVAHRGLEDSRGVGHASAFARVVVGPVMAKPLSRSPPRPAPPG